MDETLFLFFFLMFVLHVFAFIHSLDTEIMSFTAKLFCLFASLYWQTAVWGKSTDDIKPKHQYQQLSPLTTASSSLLSAFKSPAMFSAQLNPYLLVLDTVLKVTHFVRPHF